MPGTVKLIGNADQHWDDKLETVDHSIDTRLLGKEDVYWDSDGTDEQGSFVDRTGTDRVITKLNASHIPLPAAVRTACGGATNVAGGMLKLSEMAGVQHPVMEKDTEVILAATLSALEKQALIDSQIKNLGGFTLTFTFPAAINLDLNVAMAFSGFYNGKVVVNLNGITVSDNINIGKLFHLQDCMCHVEITTGTMTHTASLYAVLAERCPQVYLTGIAFSSFGTATNFAFCGIDSDGFASNCTFINDNQVSISGLAATHAAGAASSSAASAVTAHNTADTPHAGKFDAAGTAAAAVTAHNTADTPHAGKFDAAGTAASASAAAVSAHDSADTPHAGKFDAAGAAATASASAVSTHDAAATPHNGILAPLASPTFTGVPTAPTAATGTSTMQLANAAFVQNTITARFAGSPHFSDAPTAPTAATGTSTMQLATTEFVQSAIPASFSGDGIASHSVNGYQKLPGGLIIQWGTSAASAANQAFPITFPHAAFAIVQAGTIPSAGGQLFQIVNKSYFKIIADPDSYTATPWIAIGW